MHGTANLLNFAYISIQVGETNDNIDYTLPENFAVDFFLNHKVSKKKNFGVFELKARWKGFTEGEDACEPLTNQAKDSPALAKEYLMKISAEETEPIKKGSCSDSCKCLPMVRPICLLIYVDRYNDCNIALLFLIKHQFHLLKELSIEKHIQPTLYWLLCIVFN
jgi:hypothetical protein